MAKVIKLDKSGLVKAINSVLAENNFQQITEGGGSSDMRKIIYFGFNFPHDFIQTVWVDDQSLAKHLMGKFKDFYERVGAGGAFFKFYVELDEQNQQKLEEYIRTNYRG